MTELARRDVLRAGAAASAVAGLGAAGVFTAAPSASAATATPSLKRGDTGPAVHQLQQLLNYGRFWLDSQDGVFGGVTRQAVLALQKTVGLARTGTVGAKEWAALNAIWHAKGRFPLRPVCAGTHLEVNLAKQTLTYVSAGEVYRIFNCSTGSGEWFTFQNRRIQAITPRGHWHTFWGASTGWQEGELGKMWKPRFFSGNYAIHGSTSIPAYPASHGCVRVSTTAMDFMLKSGIVTYRRDLVIF